MNLFFLNVNNLLRSIINDIITTIIIPSHDVLNILILAYFPPPHAKFKIKFQPKFKKIPKINEHTIIIKSSIKYNFRASVPLKPLILYK